MLSVFLYFGLRKHAPSVARLSLSLGGALVGFLLVPFVVTQLAGAFNVSRIWSFLGVPLLFVAGAIAGFLTVFRWTDTSRTRRRRLTIAILVILLGSPIVSPFIVLALLDVLRLVGNDPRALMMHERSLAITDFTASPQSVVFTVPLNENDRALVFVDRTARRARLIGEDGFRYYEPRLSWDGERLLFVKQKKNGAQHQLISCFVATWHCRIIVDTTNDVYSPVEIDKNTIIYSSSPLITSGDRQFYLRHDFYLAKPGSNPIRLTHFKLPGLHSINVIGEKILFGAVTSSRPDSIFPESKPLANPRSEIFELGIDRDEPRVIVPAGELIPQFLVGGYSVDPSASEDGKKVAFLNTNTAAFHFRYDLMVVDTSSGARKLIELEGKNFSRAAFAGEQMLYNELLNDRYRVMAWNPTSDTSDDVFEIKFSKLKDLEQISLSTTAAE